MGTDRTEGTLASSEKAGGLLCYDAAVFLFPETQREERIFA